MKLKKVLSGLLAAALVFSSVAWPAQTAYAAQAISGELSAADYAKIHAGGGEPGRIRVGVAGGDLGLGGYGFMENGMSWWSGVEIPFYGSGNVATHRAAFVRLPIPNDIDWDANELTVQFTVYTTHNSGYMSITMFALNEPLPADLSEISMDYAADAERAAEIREGFSGRALAATSSAINSPANNTRLDETITFDLTDYARANPGSSFEFIMLADAQMLTLYDSSAANEEFRPQWFITPAGEAAPPEQVDPVDEVIPADDAPSSWAVEHVERAVELDLVPANLNSAFTQSTTRAEFAALAVALYENVVGEITGRVSFVDTDDVNVEKMAYLGVVGGVGDNRFDPDSNLTREQAAVLVARLAEAIGEPFPDEEPTFADNAEISAWAVEGVGQAQAAGIMGGVGDNRFAPLDPYTREQSIITMLRLFDMVA